MASNDWLMKLSVLLKSRQIKRRQRQRARAAAPRTKRRRCAPLSQRYAGAAWRSSKRASWRVPALAEKRRGVGIMDACSYHRAASTTRLERAPALCSKRQYRGCGTPRLSAACAACIAHNAFNLTCGASARGKRVTAAALLISPHRLVAPFGSHTLPSLFSPPPSAPQHYRGLQWTGVDMTRGGIAQRLRPRRRCCRRA